MRKFDFLLDKANRHSQPPSSQWVVNLSSKELTQPQTSVLAKGLNYALPPKQTPIPEIVACTEDALQRAKIPPEASDRTRTQIIGILSKAKPTSSNLSPSESKALKEL